MSRLLPELTIAKADGSYPKLLSSLARLDLLILDDWGLTTLTKSESNDILEVLEDRAGLRSTVVASQLPVNHWHEAFGDPTVADAILDRLIHSAHRITLQGESMRKLLQGDDLTLAPSDNDESET